MDAPPIEPPIVNHRYELALASERAKLTRTPTDTTRATCALSFDEKCALVETGKLLARKNGTTYRETKRILIALAYARVRYGETRNGKQRFRFYFRTSSQGERVLDSRTGEHVSMDFARSELTRLGLHADAICAHLASVCAPARPPRRQRDCQRATPVNHPILHTFTASARVCALPTSSTVFGASDSRAPDNFPRHSDAKHRRNTMKVSIEKNEIVIRLPVAKNPAPSKSGKTRLVATTGGFVDAGAQISGHPLRVAVNATIPA